MDRGSPWSMACMWHGLTYRRFANRAAGLASSADAVGRCSSVLLEPADGLEPPTSPYHFATDFHSRRRCAMSWARSSSLPPSSTWRSEGSARR
jgi:hypothetical protein